MPLLRIGLRALARRAPGPLIAIAGAGFAGRFAAFCLVAMGPLPCCSYTRFEQFQPLEECSILLFQLTHLLLQRLKARVGLGKLCSDLAEFHAQVLFNRRRGVAPILLLDGPVGRQQQLMRPFGFDHHLVVRQWISTLPRRLCSRNRCDGRNTDHNSEGELPRHS